MGTLDDLIARVAGLPKGEQAKLYQMAVEHKAKNKWTPNPGPQTDAYFSKADCLLFGGEPGGGKSQLILGLAHNEHKRSLIMRRQYGDLDRIIEDCLKIHGSRDGFNGSPPPKLRTAEGRVIDFAAAHRVGDEQGQMGKGRDLLCVGRGTQVVMADGSLKAIEAIVLGDSVATLEGGRRVTKVWPVRRDRAVSVTAGGVTQIQSESHSLLTTSGWASFDTFCESRPSCFSLPTQHHVTCKTSSRFWPIFSAWLRHHALKVLDLLPLAVQAQLAQGQIGRPATSACALRPGAGSACAESCESSQARLLRSLSSAAVAPPQPHARVVGRGWRGLIAFVRDAFGARASSSHAGLTDHCLSCIHPCDERLRLVIHRQTSPAAYQRCAPLSGDAEPQSPIGSAVDGLDRIPTHSDRTGWFYHPYSKDIRQTEVESLSASFEMVRVGMVDLHDIEVQDANHYITVGGFVNKNCIDEATHFAKSQIRFLMGWNRSDDPNQRVRTVLATNPPLSAEGLWVIEMFAPWLDPQYPYPAKPGELRWLISDPDGNDQWVDGPGEYETVVAGKTKIVRATSRTYIPSSVKDNPYYVASGYEQTLDAMPEPYRSLLMGGFRTAFVDAENQIIPTKWVQLAQERWTARPKPPEGIPMCAMGVDASGGGTDPMVISMRYDGWFAPNQHTPGKEIPVERSGAHCAGIVISHRRNGALVTIDMGGGYGGPMYEHLHANEVEVKAYKGAESTVRRSSDGKLKFVNVRTAALWMMREALDPGQPGGSPIFLPPDQKTLADLTAPTFEPTPQGIRAESKDKVCERLGRSTDDGDAVVMCWWNGPRHSTHAEEWIDQRIARKASHNPKPINSGRVPLTARRVR